MMDLDRIIFFEIIWRDEYRYQPYNLEVIFAVSLNNMSCFVYHTQCSMSNKKKRNEGNNIYTKEGTELPDSVVNGGERNTGFPC